MFERYKLTNAFFQDASDISNEKGKKLLVIGDSCGGTYFQFITKYFLDYGHRYCIRCYVHNVRNINI
ncbi:MAG: hypothetical protein VX625_01320 [Candidatus Thermoplasmatota archaeon]|nr:hypothetical protein [Candidatus Thermoplasmatota archaeon]